MKHSQNITHSDYLNKFPTTEAAATAFGVAPGNIRQWKLRGIPAAKWPQAEQIAKAHKWGITAAMLAESRPSKGADTKAKG